MNLRGRNGFSYINKTENAFSVAQKGEQGNWYDKILIIPKINVAHGHVTGMTSNYHHAA